MKERTLQILSALIQDFVETGNPVASKKLLTSGEFNISSATIRNEFALLEEIGFIRSPHISAGKIPTEKGYRFFVDELIEGDQKSVNELQNVFKKHIETYQLEKTKETISDSLRIMSQISGNVAFASINNDRTFYLGLSNVLRAPEFMANPEKAAQVIEVLEGRDKFQAMLQQIDIEEGQVKIFIGNENILEEVNSCAMIVAPLKTKWAEGHIGILGPMRMRYGFNRALVRNILEMVG
jgi:heat-inducible transcriptional repressor